MKYPKRLQNLATRGNSQSTRKTFYSFVNLLSRYLDFLSNFYDQFKKHIITVAFYARVIYPKWTNRDKIFLHGLKHGATASDISSFNHLKNGIAFKDFYKKVMPARITTKSNFIERIKLEMIKFIDTLPLEENPFNSGRKSKIDSPFLGVLCYSQNSNLLEVISLFHEKYDPI